MTKPTNFAHLVQFYQSDQSLLNALVDFFKPGFQSKDTIIVIATPEHRTSLEQRLMEEGIDTDWETASSRLCFLDAQETLDLILDKGMPNRSRFEEIMCGWLACNKGVHNQKIRTYGEMVALLWEQGNKEGALKLEEMWNDLGQQKEFSHFCGYPKQQFEHKPDSQPFTKLCGIHSSVVYD